MGRDCGSYASCAVSLSAAEPRCHPTLHPRRQEWGDTTSVAQQVSDAKEPIYQRLTAAGIAAFPGVAALVVQVCGEVGSGWSGCPRALPYCWAACRGHLLHLWAASTCARALPTAALCFPCPLQARQLGMGVAVASSGSPDKIAHNLGSSGLAHLFPDPHLVRS